MTSIKDTHQIQVTEDLIEGTKQKKKRVGKACDLCRLKKTKCNGMKPCMRCITNNNICTYTERRRPKEKIYPVGYVELLETRLELLSKAMTKLYEMCELGEDISFLRSEITGELSINKLIGQLTEKEELISKVQDGWDIDVSLGRDHTEEEEHVKGASTLGKRVDKKGRGKYTRRKNSLPTRKLANEVESEMLSHSSPGSSEKSPVSIKSEDNGLEKFGFNIDLSSLGTGQALATALNNSTLNSQHSDFDSDGEDNCSPRFSSAETELHLQSIYYFPETRNIESTDISKNNSISSIPSIDALKLESPISSEFNDLSTHKIQTSGLQVQDSLLRSPTLVSQNKQSHDIRCQKQSISQTLSPRMNITKTNSMIAEPANIHQTTMLPLQQEVVSQQSKMYVGFNDTDYSGLLGNVIESSSSCMTNIEEFHMNNNPIPYNV